MSAAILAHVPECPACVVLLLLPVACVAVAVGRIGGPL